MTITARDAREIADRLLAAAQAIDDYLDAHWQTISRPDYETLNESGKTLLRISSFVTTEAVGLALEEVEDDAAQLKHVIDEATETIRQLTNVRRAIRFAAGLADLATGIMSKDPKAISKSLRNLAGLIGGDG